MTETLNPDFAWKRHPPAANWVASVVRRVAAALPFVASLQQRMEFETGTRLVDWIDHVRLPASDEAVEALSQVGFQRAASAEYQLWTHAEGLFPCILVSDHPVVRLSLEVESVTDFLFAHQADASILGRPHAPFRIATVSANEAAELSVVERHGHTGFAPLESSCDQATSAFWHAERFALRKRLFETDADGFRHASALIKAAISDLGVDMTCDLFFAAERRYWQSRNQAAQVQKRRQDRLGLGWANHDHHTYRSSREHFARLVEVFELLGFRCRERFYGGAEAGWGAQVLEQPATGVVIFADVDLTPTEVVEDFAHEGLLSKASLGTVGLWCKLHGEAFLQAGMHHLECQYNFDAIRPQLAQEGVEAMAPFTDMEHLKQAFTQGEVWPIADQRIDAALSGGFITPVEATQFRDQGSIGSHLEMLQRRDGYKGFNQTGISEIIRETDPRRASRTISFDK